jgi:hypothetical protein
MKASAPAFQYLYVFLRLEGGNLGFELTHVPVECFRYPVQILQILYQFTDHIIYGGSAGGAFGDILKDDFPAVFRYEIGNRVLLQKCYIA